MNTLLLLNSFKVSTIEGAIMGNFVRNQYLYPAMSRTQPLAECRHF